MDNTNEKTSPSLVIDRTNKIEPEYSGQSTYHEGSGVTLSTYNGAPSFRPVEGGAMMTIKDENRKDVESFVKSGQVLTFENDNFKHVVTIK